MLEHGAYAHRWQSSVCQQANLLWQVWAPIVAGGGIRRDLLEILLYLRLNREMLAVKRKTGPRPFRGSFREKLPVQARAGQLADESS